jgi:myosin protein heavy chain
LQAQLRTAEETLHNIAARLEDEGRESSNMDLLHKRLAEELDDEREQHQKDLAERDFTIDQTRKKYQGNRSFVFLPSTR